MNKLLLKRKGKTYTSKSFEKSKKNRVKLKGKAIGRFYPTGPEHSYFQLEREASLEKEGSW